MLQIKEMILKQISLALFQIADVFATRLHYYSAVVMREHLKVRAKNQAARIIARQGNVSGN